MAWCGVVCSTLSLAVALMKRVRELQTARSAATAGAAGAEDEDEQDDIYGVVYVCMNWAYYCT